MAEEKREEELSTKQTQAIELLLAGVNIVGVAAQLKLNESTVRRWLKLPHVKQAYRAAQREMFDASLDELRQGLPDVFAMLHRHIKEGDVEPTAASQLQAGRAWLEYAVQIYKLEEIEARLAALENGGTPP